MELHDLFLANEKYKDLSNAVSEGYQAGKDEVDFMNHWEQAYDLKETPYDINQEEEEEDED